MGWNLPLRLPGVVSAALDSVATNLSANEILKLASWLVGLDGSRIRQSVITAPGKMIDGRSVLVAEPATLKNAVIKLLTAPGLDSEEVTTTTTSEPSATTTSAVGAPGTTALGSSTTSSATAVSTSTTTTTVAAGDFRDGQMWRSAQQSVPFALEAPRFVPSGFDYAYKMPTGDGTYQIDPGENSKPAVRMLYR
jgi:hypothetical protein